MVVGRIIYVNEASAVVKIFIVYIYIFMVYTYIRYAASNKNNDWS